MFIVGLTGGIGSGKSAAAETFKSLGITLVNADEVARTVVTPGSPALQKIQQHFGASVIQDDGNLNRKVMRERVFDNSTQLKWLENLLHPLINQNIKRQLDSAASDYAILESPILIESGQHKMVDRILVIDASEEQQLERASHRDASNHGQIKAIMKNQLSREARRSKADDVIINNSDLENLRQSVLTLHADYLTLARGKNNYHDTT